MIVSTTRAGTNADAIDGVLPRHVAEPDSAQALARTLAEASQGNLQTVIRGGGTKLGWGRPPAAVDLVVSTARLNSLIAHRHGDLTVTAQAGMPLAELNATLRQHQQWLPVESAFGRATVGGLVAANDAGPSRHRNGTPRDLVIGVTLALTDGRIVKSGGTVVKNVAGYDLARLMSGSHGAYAAIADVTFKLVPVPHASATVVAEYDEVDGLARDAAAIAASQLEPAAFDVRAESEAPGVPRLALLIRFASSPVATTAQVDGARAMLTGGSRVVAGPEEDALWTSQIALPWKRDDAVIRFAWMPDALPRVLRLVAELQHASGAPAGFAARVLGTGLLRLGGDAARQASAVARLRGTPEVANVVVLRASPRLKGSVDVWGAPRDSEPVARALKYMFDPSGILNAGRGPL